MHWTYSNCKEEKNLSQGDILDVTEELKELLCKIHPEFAQDQHLGVIFQVSLSYNINRFNRRINL